MADVVLVYPYFYSCAKDKSIFKFPPLGLGYLASSLMDNGISVEIIDGSFLDPPAVVEKVKKVSPKIAGFYVMLTMEQSALELAASIRDYCGLLVAGGPYPTASPDFFLPHFDLVALGEAEKSLPEMIEGFLSDRNPYEVPGFAYWEGQSVRYSPVRARIEKLDEITAPARSLFDNDAHKEYWQRNYGYTTTSMITTRGCPFKCGFCSKPVFGDDYKERTASNVVDEIEEILEFGYDRIWMADDCFTLNKRRVAEICEGILTRGLRFEWECLSRVDGIDTETLNHMREAGCVRLFFGLESGNDQMLRVMKKNTTTAAGRKAVDLAVKCGLKTGGFFILGYPGETNRTLIQTINFSSSLPLHYLSYTVPYPLPGTDLFSRVKNRINDVSWMSPRRHRLLYRSDFSMHKLNLAMAKGTVQHWLRSKLGGFGSAIELPFRWLTNGVLRLVP